MSRHSVADILALRFAVGYLGERGQNDWWPSGFLAATAQPFLRPVFGTAVLGAQYHGACEAARRVHDDRIGIGKVFHLFRLPDTVENDLFERLTASSEKPEFAGFFSSVDAAKAKLTEIGGDPAEISPGPRRVGETDAIEESASIAKLAACYLAAFNGEIRCFPYFSSRS